MANHNICIQDLQLQGLESLSEMGSVSVDKQLMGSRGQDAASTASQQQSTADMI
jgi:hypothetical protein